MSAFNLSIWRGEPGREEEGEEGRVKYICAAQLCAGVHSTLNSFYHWTECLRA